MDGFVGTLGDGLVDLNNSAADVLWWVTHMKSSQRKELHFPNTTHCEGLSQLSVSRHSIKCNLLRQIFTMQTTDRPLLNLMICAFQDVSCDSEP